MGTNPNPEKEAKRRRTACGNGEPQSDEKRVQHSETPSSRGHSESTQEEDDD